MNLSIGRIYPLLFYSLCVFVCVCATCRGRLSMRQQHPKAISSRLVRMKALIALVTFWILPSLLGPVVWLIGHKHTARLPLYAGPSYQLLSLHRYCWFSWWLTCTCSPCYTPSSSSPWCIRSEDMSRGTAAAVCQTWTSRNSLKIEQDKSN